MTDSHTDNTYRSLLKYIGLFGSTQALNQLSALVRSKLTALLLGPGGVGVLSLFVTTNQLLTGVGGLGLSTSGVREVASAATDAEREREVIASVRAWGLIGALLAGICCLMAAPWLSVSTFGSADYVGQFRLLALAIVLGVELVAEQAVLKGIRRLREVVVANLITTVASVVVVVPLYYYFRRAAVVPAITATALLGFCSTAYYSFRYAPWDSRFATTRAVSGGIPMMKLGFAFMLAAAAGAAVNYLIRTFIAAEATLADVGYYNTGYTICCAYMGIVLTSIDVDYFTRLTALQHDREGFSALVNRQIELSLVLVAPLLSALLIGVELAVRILYSEAFLAAGAMIVWAWLFVYLRGANLSLSYIALARSDKRVFLMLEVASALLMLGLSVAGFRLDGVRGLGIALSAEAVLELMLLSLVAHRRFGVRCSGRLLRSASAFLLMPLGAFLLTHIADRGWLYWSVGSGYVLFCLGLTWWQLRRRIRLQ